MDKTAIKNFAIEARKILRKSAATEAGFYGITKDECKSPVQKGNDFEVYETLAGMENRVYGDDIKRRANLVKAIQEQGFEQVIEETAYTWFNRIIAIRFMEVNNYLPTRVRVLSSETGGSTPDIVTQADTVDLNLTVDELHKIQEAKRENRYDDAFRLLFIKQCNELNGILPGLFEKTDDYMELLLKITYTGDGVIRMLIDIVPEDNFNVEEEEFSENEDEVKCKGQVEIIGWMYQYYNTELKDDTFAKLKKNIKITKERIPAATQLFTPDWIVRYMVENSVGRVWIDHLRAVDPSIDEKTKAEEFGWKYYLPEAEQEEDVAAKLVEIRNTYKDLTPQDITCMDPCMGSGHILVYMFDVLMDIYRSEGFSEREAVFDILKKNIRGLDIDRRAYQLSYFALMMKAREYNRIFFRGYENADGERVQAVPRVYAIEESNPIDRKQLKYFGTGLDEAQKNNAISQMNGLLDTLKDAKEYGSILNVENYEWELLRAFVTETGCEGQMTFESLEAEQSKKLLMRLIDVGELLAGKYDAVVTNPPYMGSGGMSDKLLHFIKKNYFKSKSDLFAVFIEKCGYITKMNAYYAMLTQNAWMFLSSFEKLRSSLNYIITVSMLHLGAHAFDEIGGEVVQTSTFLNKKNQLQEYKGIFIKLTDFVGEVSKSEKALMAYSEQSKGLYFRAKKSDFAKVPGSPYAYWGGAKLYKIFKESKMLKNFGRVTLGMRTGNNNRFLRLWFEVCKDKLKTDSLSARDAKNSKMKWFPYNKGGEFRKWYGNLDYVVNWEDDGKEIKDSTKLAYPELGDDLGWKITSEDKYFYSGLAWSRISSSNFGVRLVGTNLIFDTAAPMFFPEDNYLEYFAGFMCSKVASYILNMLNPTITFQVGDISKLPVIIDERRKKCVEKITHCCWEIEKWEWDSFETSWDFKGHPLVFLHEENKEQEITQFARSQIEKLGYVQRCYEVWENKCDKWFNLLKENEKELNNIFIDIYGLREELSSEVENKDITIRKAHLGRDIRSLVSYAVGCMFGRYSLDEEGLVYAGGEFDAERYKTFPVAKDAIIPITEEVFFEDDIAKRFELFIKAVYGEKTLEQNLDFIADALGTKGTLAREKIRNYFLNDFFKDHCNTYSVTGSGKRPIYWLFDSGKQNGFKCLIYLHRYTPDTVGLIRSDYLIKTQSAIENALKNAEYAISASSSAVDKAQATKKRDKYIKRLAEIRAYYPALSHIALQRIELDLDDGVKVNYAKFQGIEVGGEGEKKQKIDLLAKI
ncbi:MAG: BREX-1 system adenine-specific DNA-methyltransferase PglX [Lachnospiraceae bacterium]